MTYQMMTGEIRLCAVERPSGWKIVTTLGGKYWVTWLKHGTTGTQTGKTSTDDADEAIQLFDAVNLNE